MSEIVGVRFREAGKMYYFDPDGRKLKKNDYVIVETSRGVECGRVVMENAEMPESEIVQPLKKLSRKADEKDLERLEENREKEREAFKICREKIKRRRLDMKLVAAERAFDGGKLIFYFTADGRIDFRELVKDLAGVFRTRIELRQIGVRDSSKLLGGFGVCGRPFCCKNFLCEFNPVSIKMAKEQGLSLNSSKISGVCGRLMCCLKYEQNVYEELLKTTPKPGAIVNTRDGLGTVVDFSLLSGLLKVQLKDYPEAPPKTFNRRDVKLVKDSQITVDRAEKEALKDIEG